MMHKVIVSENAIRELIREALNNNQYTPEPHLNLGDNEPVKVNDVVDPSAALSNPGNEDFRPDTPAEFQVAVKSLVDDLPGDKISDIYEKLVKALENENEDKGEKMKKDTKTEAIIRAQVRKLIRENLLNEAPPGARSAYADTAPFNYETVGAPLGLSGSGARRLIDLAIAKSKWIASMYMGAPQDVEKLILKAHNDYIQLLKSSGELTPEEVADLRKNPEHVAELDGFREFLDKYIRNAMRKRPEGFPIKKGDIPWTPSKL